jgi:hypothetical protein
MFWPEHDMFSSGQRKHPQFYTYNNDNSKHLSRNLHYSIVIMSIVRCLYIVIGLWDACLSSFIAYVWYRQVFPMCIVVPFIEHWYGVGLVSLVEKGIFKIFFKPFREKNLWLSDGRLLPYIEMLNNRDRYFCNDFTICIELFFDVSINISL